MNSTGLFLAAKSATREQRYRECLRNLRVSVPEWQIVSTTISVVVFLWMNLLANANPSSVSRSVLSLDGSGWTLIGMPRGEGEKARVFEESSGAKGITTSVPNNVQLAIGLKDPYGQNKELVEINQKEWWYVRAFTSPRSMPSQETRLVFDGVDYLADVW